MIEDLRTKDALLLHTHRLLNALRAGIR